MVGAQLHTYQTLGTLTAPVRFFDSLEHPVLQAENITTET